MTSMNQIRMKVTMDHLLSKWTDEQAERALEALSSGRDIDLIRVIREIVPVSYDGASDLYLPALRQWWADMERDARG